MLTWILTAVTVLLTCDCLSRKHKQSHFYWTWKGRHSTGGEFMHSKFNLLVCRLFSLVIISSIKWHNRYFWTKQPLLKPINSQFLFQFQLPKPHMDESEDDCVLAWKGFKRFFQLTKLLSSWDFWAVKADTDRVLFLLFFCMTRRECAFFTGSI